MRLSSKHNIRTLELLPVLKGMNNILPADMLDSNTATNLNGAIEHNGNSLSIRNIKEISTINIPVEKIKVIHDRLFTINKGTVYEGIGDYRSVGYTKNNILFGFGEDIFCYDNTYKRLNLSENKQDIEYETKALYKCFRQETWNWNWHQIQNHFALNRIFISSLNIIFDPNTWTHAFANNTVFIQQILYGDDSLLICSGDDKKTCFVVKNDFVFKPLDIFLPSIIALGYRENYMYFLSPNDNKYYKCDISKFREDKDSYTLRKSDCIQIDKIDGHVINDPEVFRIKKYSSNGILYAEAYDTKGKKVSEASIEDKGTITVNYFAGYFVFGIANNSPRRVFTVTGPYDYCVVQEDFWDEEGYNNTKYYGTYYDVAYTGNYWDTVRINLNIPNGTPCDQFDGNIYETLKRDVTPTTYPDINTVTHQVEVQIKRGDEIYYSYGFNGVEKNVPPLIAVDRRGNTNTLYIQCMHKLGVLTADIQLNQGQDPVVRNGRVITYYDNDLYYSAIGEIDFTDKGTDDSGKVLEVGYKEDGEIVKVVNAIDLIVFKSNKKVHRIQGEYPNWIVSTIGESSPPISNVIVVGNTLIYYCDDGLKQINTSTNYGDYIISDFPSNVYIKDCKSILVSKKRNSLLFATIKGVFEYNIILKSWSNLKNYKVENLIEYQDKIYCIYDNKLSTIEDDEIGSYNYQYARAIHHERMIVKSVTLWASGNGTVSIDIGNGKTYTFTIDTSTNTTKQKTNQIATTKILQPTVTAIGEDIIIDKIVIEYAIIGDE